MARTLVATGFSPWGRYQRNASWDCLQRAEPKLPLNCRLHRVEIPVDWLAVADFAQKIPLLEPLAVIAFGQYEGSGIRLERYARSENSRVKPDGNGNCCVESQDPRATRILETSFPLQQIEAALLSQSLPCFLSENAGDYLCNCLYYQLLAQPALLEKSVPVIFVHVPADGGMEDESVILAMETCIAHAAETASLTENETPISP